MKDEKELYFNLDDSNFFYTQKPMEGNAGERIDHYVDLVADAGVSTFLCCINARRTNYRTKVWTAYWDGYDPEGPDTQPFFAAVPPKSLKRYRNFVDNILSVHQQGINYPARIVQRCRQRGISPWITLRMNDCHFNNIPNHPFHGAFWKENPQFFIKGKPGYFAHCLDYAHREVRDYFMALIEEAVTDYEVDGLELDFMRDPYIFSAGKEAEGRAVFTDWLREVRRKIASLSATKKRPIQLGIRIPSHPETALGMGFDVSSWAGESLLDLLVVAPRWATLDFDIPVEQWRTILGDSGIKIATGLEVNYKPHPGAQARCVSPEMAAGLAAALLSRGADAAYLFNYFPSGHPNWPAETYRKTLGSMRSLESLLTQPRNAGITYRDTVAPGTSYRPQLPASGKKISLSLNAGLVSEENIGELCVEIKASPEAAPVVAINGKIGKILPDKSTERSLCFAVPAGALKQSGPQQIEITSSVSITVVRLEIWLD